MENEFYFLCSSNSLSYHPDNKCYNFIIELPERIVLEGNWAISLCDFFNSSSLTETLSLSYVIYVITVTLATV